MSHIHRFRVVGEVGEVDFDGEVDDWADVPYPA